MPAIHGRKCDIMPRSEKSKNLPSKRKLSRSSASGDSVAVKYRDPNNPAKTWTGRGRTPRWMTAATRGGKAKKEDPLALEQVDQKPGSGTRRESTPAQFKSGGSLASAPANEHPPKKEVRRQSARRTRKVAASHS